MRRGAEKGELLNGIIIKGRSVGNFVFIHLFEFFMVSKATFSSKKIVTVKNIHLTFDNSSVVFMPIVTDYSSILAMAAVMSSKRLFDAVSQ